MTKQAPEGGRVRRAGWLAGRWKLAGQAGREGAQHFLEASQLRSMDKKNLAYPRKTNMKTQLARLSTAYPCVQSAYPPNYAYPPQGCSRPSFVRLRLFHNVRMGATALASTGARGTCADVR